jgi:hypothetical protein
LKQNPSNTERGKDANANNISESEEVRCEAKGIGSQKEVKKRRENIQSEGEKIRWQNKNRGQKEKAFNSRTPE